MGYLDNRFYVLAHRGGYGKDFTENSLEAFQNAVGLGCRYLETDVWLAEDNELYLTHSSPSWLPYRKIPVNKSLMTLENLFDAFPHAYFAIDPKHGLAVTPLADLIVRKNMVGKVCIGSSFDGRAKRVADLIEDRSRKRPATALVSAFTTAQSLLGVTGLPIHLQNNGATFVHIHRKLISPSLIRYVHTEGYKVIAWVVNDMSTMQRFKKWGVDGLMTDFPMYAKKIGLLDE